MASVSKCKSCGDAILWAVTVESKRIPIDPVPSPDGNLVIQVALHGTEMEHLRARAFEPLFDQKFERYRFKSHFATCPNADEHRSKK